MNSEGYRQHLKSQREANKAERQRLYLIRDFELGEDVRLTYKKSFYIGKVLRVNQKSYTVRFDKDRIVSIHKEDLWGYPKDVIESITGDGRRYVGEGVIMEKGLKNA